MTVVVALCAIAVSLLAVILFIVLRRLPADAAPVAGPAAVVTESATQPVVTALVAAEILSTPANPPGTSASAPPAPGTAEPSAPDANIEDADARALASADLTARGHELDRRAADLAGQARGLRTQVDQLAQRDADLGRRSGDLARQQDELSRSRTSLEAAGSALDALRSDLSRREEAVTTERARVAGLTPAQARADLIADLLAEARHDSALEARRIEANAVAQAESRAREIVAQSVQRLATPATAELTVTTLKLPSDDYKGRIIGREGRNIRAFETVTGVDVLVDETPDVVQLSCFDPVRREVGRLTMQALIADGRIHPQRIEETFATASAEVAEVCRRAAQDALLAVGIRDLDDGLVAHLGALRFRTSYGQNVLAHLVESAAVAATMAAEIGADVALVKRCAFLHDIGKALTHEVEGSHALVGADLARRHGESAAVVHAIEAHHNEVAPRTVEAVLTQASDACSGGRPGARRESAAVYLERLRRIEEIASAQPGVERVFAVQAGHEVRVMVQPDRVDDLAAGQIARAVAKQIEHELTYPGQVRVTVIRESRVSEIAH